jgi:hypothetical protein
MSKRLGCGPLWQKFEMIFFLEHSVHWFFGTRVMSVKNDGTKVVNTYFVYFFKFRDGFQFLILAIILCSSWYFNEIVRVVEFTLKQCQTSHKHFKSDRYLLKAGSFLFFVIMDRHEEYQYLNLVKDVIEHGVKRNDRTGVGTLSKFGCQMR